MPFLPPATRAGIASGLLLAAAATAWAQNLVIPDLRDPKLYREPARASACRVCGEISSIREVMIPRTEVTAVPADAARFENLVAAHLLKWVHFQHDTGGHDLELRYFRDLEGREVDFVVTAGREPRLLVECKWDDAEPDRGLRYLKARFPRAEAWQLSAAGSKDYQTREGIRVAPALALLKTLI